MRSALDTPMMRQFLAIKADHPDAIVFYRMGDFYEMFLEDAEKAAPLLDIALTSRDKGKADAVPMCGIPVHSADGYVKQLAGLGHRVAICEQVEDPKTVSGRRLVRREVVEVVTPGLVGDPAGLDGARSVRLVVLDVCEAGIGLAALDASTGDFRATDVPPDPDGAVLPDLMVEELERMEPREIVLSDTAPDELERLLRMRMPDAVQTRVPVERFDPRLAPVVPSGFSPEAANPRTRAAAALLTYLGQNQPFALSHAPRLRSYEISDTMVLDAATREHLELFENNEDRGRRGTLIERIDATRTPLGARRLTHWLAYPLLEPAAIRRRQSGVAHLAERDRVRSRLREALRAVRDLERIWAKAVRPGAVPRDLGVLRSSLQALPAVRAALASADGSEDGWLAGAEGTPPLPLPEPLPDLTRLLEEGLVDEPPVIAKGSRGANETGYIRPGFRPELDALRESATKGREWIAGLQVQERERTGIATLKVRFHPVHGYSLEVSKAQLSKVPSDYERKQTLANVERFTTEALRQIESQVMGEGERAAALEREIFESLRRAAIESAERVRGAAEAVAELDATASLAEVARREGWARPQVDAEERLSITAGRHPVVEAVLRSGRSDGFVPNDTALDPSDTQVLLLTGPNMSGKSTYLRQVALIVLLAQIGSYVPAEAAAIGVVDRIFTRVGASDRLARGESTFMVEMRECAEILRQATRRSLVILDEIGRGTSTYDGLAIAWAVIEYLHDTPGLGPRTLFATHYHELTELEASKPRVRNGHFEAREWKDEVVFLRRLASGGANRSYGIQVARLAGLPDPLIARARVLLAELEKGAGTPGRGSGPVSDADQLGLFSQPPGSPLDRAERDVLDELLGLDPLQTTPMKALEALESWRERLRRETPE